MVTQERIAEIVRTICAMEPEERALLARAMEAQNACNLSGIIHAWSRAVSALWAIARSLEKGTEWVDTHPVSQLYAWKCLDLTGGDRDASDIMAGCAAAAREEVGDAPR